MANGESAYVAYEEPNVVPALTNVPRFGKPGLSAAFSGNQEDIINYLTGILFVAILLTTIVFVWFLALLILKCFFSSGFMSGKRFQPNSRHKTRVRTVFLVAAAIWITCTALAITEGIDNLQNSVTTVSRANRSLAFMLDRAKRIVNNLFEIADESSDVRDVLVSNLGEFCPQNEDLFQETGLDLDKEAETAIEALTLLGDFVGERLVSVEEGLDTAEVTNQQIDSFVKQIDVNGNYSLFILIPWVLVPSFMLVGVIMAYCDVHIAFYECLLQWFFLPFLIFMTIASTVFSSALSIIAITNADFCSGGSDSTPRGTIQALLDAQNIDGVLRGIIEGYLSGCVDGKDAFQNVEAYQVEIETALGQIQAVSDDMIEVTVPKLQLLCGRTYDDLVEMIGKMDGLLANLMEQATNTLDLVACENVGPLVSSAVNDGLCKFSVTGFAWTFICFSIMALMGVIMVMFRSSYLGEEDERESLSLYDNTPVTFKSPPAVSSAITSRSSYDEGRTYDMPYEPSFVQGHGSNGYEIQQW
mmetsp:Transcript_14682/g.21661  ORF Transcript_14682/g.21661 Transcript_14682/m.21661 type:complete len:529 (+) Transcript_14682:54-1640(+)|eukprot:CAMPEP_0194206540 /NCGR_PEP_ID=MMETSP0156-20130528/5535_1 /TAXON_ID=33649 /ORGANISM="Thalassionema nitzschioides, Strain L26-B" /LENGTH=528 /DNA_ID=CAMNT_0038933081 /DNA_START=29 /DNA_END=1615 /DNA_ORIENTATION=-